MRVPEVRRLLLSCGLSDVATKSQLVARLRKHVADGGGVVTIVSEAPMNRRNHLRDASKAKAKVETELKAKAKAAAKVAATGLEAEADTAAKAAATPCDLASSDSFRLDRSARSGAAFAALMEVHYNLGRFHHQLGTPHLAVAAYRRVLALADQRSEDDVATGGEGEGARAQHGPAREAAHNLVQIYRASGAISLARAIMSRYLAV